MARRFFSPASPASTRAGPPPARRERVWYSRQSASSRRINSWSSGAQSRHWGPKTPWASSRGKSLWSRWPPRGTWGAGSTVFSLVWAWSPPVSSQVIGQASVWSPMTRFQTRAKISFLSSSRSRGVLGIAPSMAIPPFLFSHPMPCRPILSVRTAFPGSFSRRCPRSLLTDAPLPIKIKSV